MLKSKTYIAIPPGETIKEQLDDRGMTQKEFADRMDLTPKHISQLINGKVSLTPETAGKLELVFGIPAKFWLKLEASYRDKLIKVERENALDAEKELQKKYPYTAMAKEGLVPKTNNPKEKIINLCLFFEVTSLTLLEEKEEVLFPVACRKLANTETSDYAMRVAVQTAKRASRTIETAPIDLEKLREKLNEIRSLTLSRDMSFMDKLSGILASCGIAIVYLPELKGSFLHGITFHDNKKIVLGITMRGKYADKFWFSLFHEIAHILLHHIQKGFSITEKHEEEANKMSEDLLIPASSLENFYRAHDFSKTSIVDFANRIGTSPGIVVGRMQRNSKIGYNMFNDLKLKYALNN